MYVDQGLLHGLKHLCLHSQHLHNLPTVFSIVGGDTVPCVDHLKDWGDKQERGPGREITVDKEIPN
jgi:hypothetical protein